MQKYFKIYCKILTIFFILLNIVLAINIENIANPFAEKDSSQNTAEIKVYVVNLQKSSASTIIETLAPYFPDVLFKALETNNQIIFTARPQQYQEIKNLIAQLDKKVPQIAIQVIVLEVAENTLKEHGLLTSLSTDGLILTQKNALEAIFKMMIAEGKAYLLASPRIKSLCGKEAMIHIGDKVPYSIPSESSGKTIWNVRYLDAGINLRLLPKKVVGKYLELELKPEVASIKQWKMTSSGEYPIISTRMTDTLLRIKDQESIMIGGLLNEEEKQSITKLPFFADIPLLGKAFQRQSTEKVKTDIIFLVKAEILEQ